MPTEQFKSLPKEDQKLIKQYNQEDIKNVENQKTGWIIGTQHDYQFQGKRS